MMAVEHNEEDGLMEDVRNSDGRLVCRINRETTHIEIKSKGCITILNQKSDGTIAIDNIKF
ncbi:MAG: hypothetical protein LBN22_11840 [Clostridiales Family XIII bacterium]|nr:hypothetical protein [Clostridiales Family XIII bacterium]